MARQVRWSPRAVSSLEEICNRIGRDSDLYASLFAKRVMAIVAHVAEFPKLGRVVPEYNDEELREIPYQTYRVVYRLRAGFVEIVAICHGARLLDETAQIGQ